MKPRLVDLYLRDEPSSDKNVLVSSILFNSIKLNCSNQEIASHDVYFIKIFANQLTNVHLAQENLSSIHT